MNYPHSVLNQLTQPGALSLPDLPSIANCNFYLTSKYCNKTPPVASERHITRLSRSAPFNWASGIACKPLAINPTWPWASRPGSGKAFFISPARRQASTPQRRERLARSPYRFRIWVPNSRRIRPHLFWCSEISNPATKKKFLRISICFSVLLSPSKRSCYEDLRGLPVRQHDPAWGQLSRSKAEPLHNGKIADPPSWGTERLGRSIETAVAQEY